MSLLNKASLIQIPSGYKDGTLYSAKPTNGDGDFTFSRGSNLAATRVNSDGLIEKGRENLLLQSNQFDTTWSNASTTETGGQTDKSGGTDAWKIDLTAGGGWIFQSISTSGVQTISVYAKAGTLDWVRLYASGSSTSFAYFDLVNGLVGITSGTIDTNIELISNGYYRIDMSFNHSSTTAVRIYPAQDDGDLTATSGNIYIQDAQLELGLVATDYIETTTTTAQAGILEDMPRLDYSGGASCPSLLLEGQRTNLFEYSEYFEGSYWGKTQQGSASVPVVTGNYAISPEGVQNATRVQFDAVGSTSSDRSGLVRDFAFTSGTTYSISCWVKATSGNNELVQFRVAGSQVGGEQTATDEWQLFTATHTATVSTTDNFGMQVRGNNTTNESDILIYGMQLEQASYPTSYIPTYGAISTRSEDSCSKTGISSLIGQTEGTLFYKFNVENISTQTNDPVLVYLRGTGTESYLQLNDTGRLDAVYYASGATQCRLQKIISEGTHKVAFAYKANDFIMYIDGVLAASDTSGVIGTLNEFGLQYYNSTYFGQQKVNQAILFPTRLSNDELASLTTI